MGLKPLINHCFAIFVACHDQNGITTSSAKKTQSQYSMFKVLPLNTHPPNDAMSRSSYEVCLPLLFQSDSGVSPSNSKRDLK